jgi:hypothetical protein
VDYVQLFKKSLGGCEKCKNLNKKTLHYSNVLKQLEGKQVALIIERDFG